MRASRTMSRGLTVLAVASIGIAALAASAGATRKVSIPSKVSLSAYGYKGKVTSSNKACASERTVVLKQQGHGVLGRTKSKASGGWEVPPDQLKFKGPLPYKVFAEVKARSE